MIGLLNIQQDEVMEKPLKWFHNNNDEEDSYTSICKQFKVITKYTFDNSFLFWSNIYGELFSFMVSHQKETPQLKGEKIWRITLWDQLGSTTIASLQQDLVNYDTDILSVENYRILCQLSEDFTRGLVNCSDCKTQIKKNEAGGRYFAGIYCHSCWDRKWKAIEAKETYD
jgi:hypothetical protein